MHIHWKSLLGFGLIFWLLLTLNDFLGGPKSKKYFYFNDLYEIYENDLFVEKLMEKKMSQIDNTEHRGIQLGWSLLLWNSLAFTFSIIFCSCARIISWIMWKLYNCYRQRQFLLNLKKKSNINEKSSISRIPIMIKSNSTITRSSDTNIKIKSKINSDTSCPNLLTVRRTDNDIYQNDNNPKCHTLFTNNNLFYTNFMNDKTDHHLCNQCSKLREEILKLQSDSLKEHAILSRKLEAISKEKRELSKQLALAQKENRAAKQQLEELLEEKGILMKRLENATKEFKCNTKTKKFALAKLEEVTANAENLKLQLEQVSRDKEILQNKLAMLECEYEKLHERFIFFQNQNNFVNYSEHTPERDVNGNNKGQLEKRLNSNQQYGDNFHNKNAKNSTSLLSVSQTELDMKKIQIKIMQLEKNLENFNSTIPEISLRYTEEQESEISLSVYGNNTDSQTRTEDETDISENHFLISPRFKFLKGRTGDIIMGRTEQFANIQVLATKMQEKVRILENIKENCENIQEETDCEDYSSHESSEDIRQPGRIVSSSIAFQNFLKNLQVSESVKSQLNSQSDLNS